MQQLNRTGTGIGMALALAAIAGFVDGVGFVTLGGWFVSYMSGNSTRMAVNLVGLSWRDALFGMGLIALFVAGVAAGHLFGQDARDRVRRLLFLEAALLLAAAWLFRIDLAAAAIPLMVLAMGVANATLTRDGGHPPGVTAMTGALVRIGEGLAGAARGGPAAAIWPWLALWLALICGGAMGGALSLRWGGIVLGLPTAALMLLGFAARRDRQWHNPPPAST